MENSSMSGVLMLYVSVYITDSAPVYEGRGQEQIAALSGWRGSGLAKLPPSLLGQV